MADYLTSISPEAAAEERAAAAYQAAIDAARQKAAGVVTPAPEEPAQPEPEPELTVLPPKTGWKPDFTKPSPYEGMPQGYVELEAATYKPTEEHPLPPSLETPEGIAAVEQAPAVSERVAAIKLAPQSTPDNPMLSQENYDAFQALQDEQKFLKLMELGLIEEGSEYVPGLAVTYAPGVPVEERTLEPREWAYYTPEQVAEIQAAEAEAKAAAELRAKGVGYAQEAIEARQARELAEYETALANIREAAPGTVTTEEKVTTVNGVTTTTTITSVALEDALAAGVSESTLKAIGYDTTQINKAVEFVAAHTQLPDEQWIPNEQLAKIEAELPEAYKILTDYGLSSYNTYLDINYIQLPGEQLISVTDADAILQQSQYGYDILRKQGYDAYQQAVSDAVISLAPYQRTRGYNLRMATAQGVSPQVLSLLFMPEDVAKVENFYNEPITPKLEEIPTEAKVSSGLPPALLAIGTAAVIEPTFIGEIVAGVIFGAWWLTEGRNVDWGAVLNDIKSKFTNQTGREPTTTEVAEMENTAASIITTKAIPVVGMPQVIAMKATEPLPSVLRGTKAYEIPPLPSYVATEPLPTLLVGTKPLEIAPLPGFSAVSAIEPPIPGFEGKMEFPNIIAAAAAVADAEEELTTIIKPKIMTPSELESLWGLTETEKGFIALDGAVQDAFTAGEIDADTIRVYQTAKKKYLTQRGILDSATTTTIAGMNLPKPKTIEQENMARKIALGYAAVSESQRIAQGLKSLRAEIALDAPRIFGKAVTTNIETFESDLQVYYESIGESHASYLAKLEALNQSMLKYVGEYSPQLQNLTALAVSMTLQNLQQQANQVAIQAYNQALTQGLTQAQAQQAAQTAAQQAIQTASQTATQSAVQSATQTMTQTATQAATNTLTNTATQTAVQTAVNTAVATTTATMIQTAVDTATTTTTTTAGGIIIPPPIPPGAEPAKPVVQIIQPGSYAWKMGLFWKHIPPPYDIDKPITMKRGVVPQGAKLGRTPQETIQMIGVSKTKPKDVSIDLGIVDVFITAKGTQIAFAGKGLTTDVGKRIPSPTKGMSINKQKEGGNAMVYREPIRPLPRPVAPIQPVVIAPDEFEQLEPRERGAVDDVAELTEVSEEDVLGALEDNLDQEEDMSDLFEVSEADIMGYPEEERPRRPAPKRRLIRRTNRPYYPPPTTLGGMRY